MERRPDPPFVVVGRIGRPHGTKGELYVRLLTDHPGDAFAPGVELRVGDAEGREPDEFFPPVRVAENRPHAGGLLVFLEGVEDRTQAEFLRERYLLRPFSAVAPAEEGELFHHELLGMRVETRDGTELGTVRELYEVDPAELLEVSDGEREHLIPFTREIVVELDPEGGRIVVDPPDGLLEL